MLKAVNVDTNISFPATTNVPIFGNSGGGHKISTLLGIPAAKGLFHRACIESSSIMRVQARRSGTQVAALFTMFAGE